MGFPFHCSCTCSVQILWPALSHTGVMVGGSAVSVALVMPGWRLYVPVLTERQSDYKTILMWHLVCCVHVSFIFFVSTVTVLRHPFHCLPTYLGNVFFPCFFVPFTTFHSRVLILFEGAPTVVVHRQSSAPCRCYRTSVASASLKRSNLLLVKQRLSFSLCLFIFFYFFLFPTVLSLTWPPFPRLVHKLPKGMLMPDVT